MTAKFTLAVILAIAILIFLSPPPASAISAKKIIEKVEKRYDNLTDFRADFHQTVSIDSSDTAGYSASGTLWVKKPNKFRLELEQQTSVSDGRTLWTYVPHNNQVLVDHADTTGGAARPDQLFLKYFKQAEAKLVGTEQVSGLDCYHLHLCPTGDGDISSLHVWVDKDTYLARRLKITDAGGMVTDYRFTEVRMNPGLSDSIFIFQVPDGVEVIDMRW